MKRTISVKVRYWPQGSPIMYTETATVATVDDNDFTASFDLTTNLSAATTYEYTVYVNGVDSRRFQIRQMKHPSSLVC